MNIFQELKTKLHDEDFEPRIDCEPTPASPGSLEKLFVLAERVERGQPLYHPFDECILATVAMEFEKAKHINRLYREAIEARRQVKRVKTRG
jgi:hypothetical protein